MARPLYSSVFCTMPSVTYDTTVRRLVEALEPYGDSVQWLMDPTDPEIFQLWVRKHTIDISKIDLTKKIVVIQLLDYLETTKLGRTDEVIRSDFIEQFNEFARQHADITFVFFTLCEFLDQELAPGLDNVVVITPGGHIIFEDKQYQRVTPCIEKNISSNKCYMSLSSTPRPHRVASTALLYALGLLDTGVVSLRFDNVDGLTDDSNPILSWATDASRMQLKHGFDWIAATKGQLVLDTGPYARVGKRNSANFAENLYQLYQNVFVEVVNETNFVETSANITEKTLNCFLGGCFPIVMSTVGTVSFLRSVGFDMFDDIIDHSYDLIRNPAERMYQALTANQHLLKDVDLVRQKYTQNRGRLQSNADYAQNNMHDWFRTRALTQIKNKIPPVV